MLLLWHTGHVFSWQASYNLTLSSIPASQVRVRRSSLLQARHITQKILNTCVHSGCTLENVWGHSRTTLSSATVKQWNIDTLIKGRRKYSTVVRTLTMNDLRTFIRILNVSRMASEIFPCIKPSTRFVSLMANSVAETPFSLIFLKNTLYLHSERRNWVRSLVSWLA